MPRVEDRGRFVTYPNNIVFRRVWLQDHDDYYYVCLDCGWTCLNTINFCELMLQHAKDHDPYSFIFSIDCWSTCRTSRHQEDESKIPSKQEPKPRRMLRIGIYIPT